MGEKHIFVSKDEEIVLHNLFPTICFFAKTWSKANCQIQYIQKIVVVFVAFGAQMNRFKIFSDHVDLNVDQNLASQGTFLTSM